MGEIILGNGNNQNFNRDFYVGIRNVKKQKCCGYTVGNENVWNKCNNCISTLQNNTSSAFYVGNKHISLYHSFPMLITYQGISS